MSQALQLLYDEHEIISSVIDYAKNQRSIIETDPEGYDKSIREVIRFLREYADQFHHYKEELILFPEMARKNELLEEGIIQEMLDNHTDFREMIRDIESFLNSKNYTSAHRQLERYVNGLADHIAVENDEVFQIAESLFTEREMELIIARFDDCDRELGFSKKEFFESYSNFLVKVGN